LTGNKKPSVAPNFCLSGQRRHDFSAGDSAGETMALGYDCPSAAHPLRLMRIEATINRIPTNLYALFKIMANILQNLPYRPRRFRYRKLVFVQK
jgi:hypothetical protein